MTQHIASRYPARSGEQGFTLVELAIVLIIIGLLIGGILKGQELIANAQIKSVVSQIKGFDAAVTTFRDSYGALPGDMLTPGNRLPNCGAAPCNTAALGGTLGNNRIETAGALGAAPVATDEGYIMWSQLVAADILSGIQATAAAVAFGTGGLPSTSIGGGAWAGYNNGTAAVTGLTAGAAMRTGQYFVLNGTPLAVGAATGGLEPLQAQRIDRTLDDGLPLTGTVLTGGAGGTCTATIGGTVDYNNAPGANPCALFIRFQG
jgi:prepilin-type N-terminal cleavage/methylation domain-containing protein